MLTAADALKAHQLACELTDLPYSPDPEPPRADDPEFLTMRAVNFLDLEEYSEARRLLVHLAIHLPPHRFTGAADAALSQLVAHHPNNARLLLLRELQTQT